LKRTLAEKKNQYFKKIGANTFYQRDISSRHQNHF
jgi:hypothetical protein